MSERQPGGATTSETTTSGSTTSGATTSEAISAIPDLADRIGGAVGKVLKGKGPAIEAAITTLLAGGHVLIEDVPGVGKTTLATALARSIDAGVRRIQFTSDMLPTDVTGLSIYDQDAHTFRFHPGPIFSNIVVGDEVNRATPKTQSALLEAMEERAVTIDGTTHALPSLFTVVATQNPQDMEGTFPLPEAQRDRFMARISLGYPHRDAEVAMVVSRNSLESGRLTESVATVAEVVEAQAVVGRVQVREEVASYLVSIVGGTRNHPGIALGGSPRAGLHLAAMARARSAMNGRAYVTPDDIAVLASTVLAHRLVPHGRFASVREEYDAATRIVAEMVASAPVPHERW
ncbi:MAG TPA: MoxR family ATPase [Actinomycetales bacterium]|nr:MoxR family ATPase [Actinomycetales bacterium]